MDNDESRALHERVAVLTRETNRILPQLFGKMIGSGGVSIDTDSMSLADPRDRHHLEWLARIAAGFVLEEQKMWEPQVDELIQKVAKHQERERSLDNLLGKLREAAANETVTVDELKVLIGEYRDPLEDHYYQIRKSHEKMQMLMDMVQTPVENAAGPQDGKNEESVDSKE